MTNTTLVCNDLIKTVGTSTPFKARLLYDNQPLTGETVTIRINGVDYNRVTDSDGYASLNINLGIGAYSTKVSFNTNPVYDSVSKEVLVRVVDKPKINLTVNSLVKTYGTPDQLIAKISDTGAFITGYGIEFTINGVTYTRETDVNGEAKLNINLNPGVYPVTVRYPGDSQFSETIKKVTVTVKADTWIDGANVNKFLGDADVYQCAVYDQWNRIYPCSVELTINGVTYTRDTNEEGLIRLNINLGPGEYPITVQYNGDSTHNPSVRRGDVVTVKSRIQTLSTRRSDGLLIPGPNQGHMESRIYVGGITPKKAKEVKLIYDLVDWEEFISRNNSKGINFTSYEITETDPRVKTAKFTTDKYMDLTDGRRWVYITSPYHENFGGKILEVEYDKDKGLYTYQCQDGRRQYMSKSRVMTSKSTIYELIEVCLIRPALSGKLVNFPISQEDKIKYSRLLSGLRPIEEYKIPPSEQIILSNYNPLDQKMGETLSYDSVIDKIMNLALYSNTGSIDVHFTPDGVCQLEPVDFERWLNTGFRLTHTDLVHYKYGFDTTNILTGVTVQTPHGDAAVKDERGELLNESTLDLSYYFGMNIGMVSPVTKQVTTETGGSGGSSSSSNTGTGRFKDKTIVVGVDTNGQNDAGWRNAVVDKLRGAGYTVESLNVGPGYFSDYDWYGPSKGKVGIYIMAASTVSVADAMSHNGFDYCIFVIRGDIPGTKAITGWNSVRWGQDSDCTSVCNKWSGHTSQEISDMMGERGCLVPANNPTEAANNALAAVNGDNVGTASASSTTTEENKTTTNTVVDDMQTYKKALEEMSKSVRDLLSFEIKLPLNHPMFKELHTNMFLWTELPQEFKLGNLSEIFKFMGAWKQNRGFNYIENRWYIEKITTKMDSSGLFATITLNAFPSSYSHYANAFRDYAKAYDQAFKQQEEQKNNSTSNSSSSGGVGQARLGNDSTETSDMACATGRYHGHAGDNENFDNCAKKGYAQEGRNYYNWARQYDNPIALAKALNDRYREASPIYYNHRYANAESTFNSSVGNCWDGCRLVKCCFDAAGFDCVVITGNIYGYGHGWNAVKWNGRWYTFDLLFDYTSAGDWGGTNTLRMAHEW